jgi:hypothetical protein
MWRTPIQLWAPPWATSGNEPMSTAARGRRSGDRAPSGRTVAVAPERRSVREVMTTSSGGRPGAPAARPVSTTWPGDGTPAVRGAVQALPSSRVASAARSWPMPSRRSPWTQVTSERPRSMAADGQLEDGIRMAGSLSVRGAANGAPAAGCSLACMDWTWWVPAIHASRTCPRSVASARSVSTRGRTPAGTGAVNALAPAGRWATSTGPARPSRRQATAAPPCSSIATAPVSPSARLRNCGAPKRPPAGRKAAQSS